MVVLAGVEVDGVSPCLISGLSSLELTLGCKERREWVIRKVVLNIDVPWGLLVVLAEHFSSSLQSLG